MTIIKGSESGEYLAPGGVNFYKSLLKDSYFLESEDNEPDSSINTFAISYREEFFEFKPSINVILDENSLRKITTGNKETPILSFVNIMFLEFFNFFIFSKEITSFM